MNVATSETLVRLGTFGGVLLLLALAEVAAPRRRLAVNRPVRWASNLGLVVLDTLAARLLLPLGAVGVALLAEERGWGLLNNLDLPAWVELALALLVLDLVLYVQHVLFHAVPLLWRLHRVHHADLDCDVTTGLRFHTLEILLSLALKGAVVLALGAPAVAVLAFEVLLNATSMFNHGNVRLPAWLDRVLRLVVVTPDLHRVHHSVVPQETNSNFGFNLPWWDHLFGTYRAQPAGGHQDMQIGLPQYRDERVVQLHWMLVLPFMDPPASPPLARPAAAPGPKRRPERAHATR